MENKGNVLMEMTEIIENKKYFSDFTFKHLTLCLKSYDEGEFFSSAIWASVFIEALLRDILFEIDGQTHIEELNSLIRTLKSFVYSNDKTVSNANKNLLKDIAGRSDEIRSKRNRLVHDTGVERGKIDVDAKDINNNVMQIIKHYVRTDIALKIKNKNSKAAVVDGVALKEPTFPIFLSSITPHTFEQGEFINSFCEKLKEIGVKPVRCTLTDFDKKDPMGKVKSVIEKCNAVIVLGLERSHVYYYKDKEGSLEESESMHRKYTSGWLQIESGMAVALNKYIFVLCQKDIHSDGIFDRGWNSYLPIELESPLDVDSPNVRMMLQKIKEFVEEYQEK